MQKRFSPIHNILFDYRVVSKKVVVVSLYNTAEEKIVQVNAMKRKKFWHFKCKIKRSGFQHCNAVTFINSIMPIVEKELEEIEIEKILLH